MPILLINAYTSAQRIRNELMSQEGIILHNKRVREVKKDMSSLGANPTPDEVNKILKKHDYNYKVPTEFDCEMCNTKYPELVSFDSDPENATTGVMVCHKCLLSAFELLEGEYHA